MIQEKFEDTKEYAESGVKHKKSNQINQRGNRKL